ncbi:MAG TPA: ABC transporter substrate-binding protein, partial [Bacteroidota bacterium]|nr:ABC transporter substrate-binding protein [Bacteroidota bacterium]
MMKQKYEEASKEFLRVLEITSKSRHAVDATVLFESIADNRLSSQSLQRLEVQIKRQDVRNLLTIKLAEKLYSIGDIFQAQRLLDEHLPIGKGGKYERRIQALREKFSKGLNIKIGVLLPLMKRSTDGIVKSVAQDVLEGSTFALGEFKENVDPFINISLEIRDTERDVEIATSYIHDLTQLNDLIAIIGPLFSNVVEACGQVSNRAKVPLISPTANAVGLGSIGRYVFQATPNLAKQGKAIAQYAVNFLKCKTLAMLAPDDSNSKILAHYFSEEVQNLGSNVLAVEFYTKDSSDLRGQIMNIRKAGMTNEPQISFEGNLSEKEILKMVRAGANERKVDSLRAIGGRIGVYQLFGLNGKKIADSLRLKVIIPEHNVENLQIPLTAIDGIFVPLENADDIGVVGSQMAYYNIKTQLLGNGEWYDLNQLDANRRYINGVIFPSDSYLDKEDSSYMKFEQSYFRAKGKKPTLNVLFGYDTMNLILTQIANGMTTREKLVNALRRIQKYPGLHSRFTFDDDGVNSEVNIIQYFNGKIQKSAEIAVH